MTTEDRAKLLRKLFADKVLGRPTIPPPKNGVAAKVAAYSRLIPDRPAPRRIKIRRKTP